MDFHGILIFIAVLKCHNPDDYFKVNFTQLRSDSIGSNSNVFVCFFIVDNMFLFEKYLLCIGFQYNIIILLSYIALFDFFNYKIM